MSTSESRPDDVNQHLSPSHQEIWRALLAVTTRGLEHVDQQMQKQSNTTLTDYEILLALSAADDNRLRMSELAQRVFVSRSRLTYRVDRLTEVGFVVREECQDDRRGLWAILTETGWQTLESATRSHHADIQRMVFDHLDDHEIATLASAMGKIADKLDPE